MQMPSALKSEQRQGDPGPRIMIVSHARPLPKAIKQKARSGIQIGIPYNVTIVEDQGLGKDDFHVKVIQGNACFRLIGLSFCIANHAGSIIWDSAQLHDLGIPVVLFMV